MIFTDDTNTKDLSPCCLMMIYCSEFCAVVGFLYLGFVKKITWLFCKYLPTFKVKKPIVFLVLNFNSLTKLINSFSNVTMQVKSINHHKTRTKSSQGKLVSHSYFSMFVVCICVYRKLKAEKNDENNNFMAKWIQACIWQQQK